MNERRLTDAELEASRWIARLEASDVTLDDHQRFRQWLAASRENRAAYEAVNRTWDKLDALKMLLPREATPPTAALKLSRRALIVGAGGLAIAAGAGVAVLSLGTGAAYAASFETPIGGRHTARLPDGSRIELNAGTLLHVSYDGRRRAVTLERGEALFDPREGRRPFVVVTPFGAVRSDGGSFMVRVTNSSTRASIISGEARLALPGRNDTLVVAEGQEALLSEAAPLISTEDEEHFEQRLAWRQGMLVFNGETLREAAGEVERQTGVTFEFEDPSLAELRIGGAIRADDLDAFIRLLEHNLEIPARREGATIILG